MKIIDLLNKIANGEKVPHFKVCEIEYYLNWRGNLLEREEGKPSCDTQWFIDKKWLNTEVEIIEEKKKIPEQINKSYNIRILDFDKNCAIKDYDMEQLIEMVQDIYGKQADIIDYLKSKGE